MYVQDHPIVDLRQSKWDKEKSVPKDGQYVFTERRFIDYRGTRAARPEYQFAWCPLQPYSKPPNREFERWKMLWGYSLVKVEDPYWPMGVTPDAEGKYVLGDTVLVKTSLANYLKKRKREIDESESSPNSRKKAFFGEAMSYGMDVDEGKLKDMLGI
jgi:hypothetical protein